MKLIFNAVSLLAIVVGVTAAGSASKPTRVAGSPSVLKSHTELPPGCQVPVGLEYYVGDGWCDPEAPYNTAACEWDGGDCCECTCQEGGLNVCGLNGYNCLDPDADCLPGTEECTATNEDWLGDGYCDGFPYNTAACNWDWGDCCECTCIDGAFYSCGSQVPYNCQDPNAGVPPLCDPPLSSCELADFEAMCSDLGPGWQPSCVYMA